MQEVYESVRFVRQAVEFTDVSKTDADLFPLQQPESWSKDKVPVQGTSKITVAFDISGDDFLIIILREWAVVRIIW
jgi:hypothetical protein